MTQIKTCSQCVANTKAGTRCKNRTCKSQFCWIHLKRDKGLRIKPSATGFGQGLFASQPFKKGDKITEYSGENLTKAQVDARYGDDTTSEYTLCLGNGPNAKCRDARNTNSGAGRFANTARGTGYRNNAKFTHATFNMRAMKKIKTGQEVFVSYGPSFRFV